jgi:Ca-activated chloride channel family protein
VRASEVLVYPVVVGPSAPAMFTQLARLSGGRAFHVDADKLAGIFGDIASELRHQYLLGYVPRAGIGAAGEWRRIDVEVKRPGVKIRAREGYVVR